METQNIPWEAISARLKNNADDEHMTINWQKLMKRIKSISGKKNKPLPNRI